LNYMWNILIPREDRTFKYCKIGFIT